MHQLDCSAWQLWLHFVWTKTIAFCVDENHVNETKAGAGNDTVSVLKIFPSGSGDVRLSKHHCCVCLFIEQQCNTATQMLFAT